MTFSEAYAIHGPDVEAVAKLLGIAPAEADRLINEEMNRRHQERHETRLSYHRGYDQRVRVQLREIRAGRLA
ncbi:hypothetical protein PH552_12210 [Rhizobium sp. CNPSo 3968]|uniref:hypothetical protein n=1 Tax=Rhizobium sp. CNPSo 3968 TaxID=3021408 RepID=UPI002549D65B|nr:hypothetical protein [Rhizobium sp. CNPSo 3968]MDK4720108.1 hypothetical protein [Rhizobium sp. CNPSo 3968]